MGTPRRDLDVGMSDDKLKLLQEEFQEVAHNRSESRVKDGDELELLSVDLNEKALAVSIKASNAEKPLITPRLFIKDKGREPESSDLRRADSDSACNLGSEDDDFQADESAKLGRYGPVVDPDE